MCKVNNRNTRRCEICSKLTINTPERRQWHRSCVFIVNFEHISQIVLLFLLLTLNMHVIADRVPISKIGMGVLKFISNNFTLTH